jgi:hypothetical protein
MKGGFEQRESNRAASGKEVGGRAIFRVMSEEELKRFMLWNDGPSLAIELSDEDIEAMYQEHLRKEIYYGNL